MNIPKGLLTKAMIATSISAIVGFGTLTFNDGGIDNIKEKFDYLKQNYENALVTINNYKTALQQKVGDIKDFEKIQDDLLAQINSLKQQIAELEKQGVQNEENKALIAQYEQRIAELEAQLNECATEQDVQSLLDEITRLQGELTKANNRVAELEQYATDSANITPTEALSVEQIMANYDTRSPLLQFEYGLGQWDSISNTTKTTVVNFLNGLAIPDSYKGSPVIMHFNRWNGTVLSIGVNDPTAYDRLISQNGYVTDYGFYLKDGILITQEEALAVNFEGVIQIEIQYIDDDTWLSLGYESIDR